MIAAYTTELRRLRRATTGRRTAFFAALVVFIIVILVAAPQAQQSPTFVSVGGAASPRAADAPTDIDLLVGRSTVLTVPASITRVSLTVPDIADAMVTAPNQLLIHGKQPGTISLFVWDRGGAIKTFEVKVRRDLTPLIAHLKQLFPGEQIEVMGSGKDVVISGTVSGQYVIDKAGEVAGGYVEKKENVVNLLKQQEGVASNQVMLRVRFAEVSRSAITELGASWFTGPGGFHDYVARATTQQFPAPDLEMERVSIQGPPDQWGGGRDTVSATGGKGTFSDFLNLFIFNNKYNVGTVIRALQEKGLFQSLAEPNLIATNGKEASFLAGGEYPYPIAQPTANGVAFTITFKEFGIRLNFTPTVLGGDLINLKVRPEVSALDFTNAIVLEGFRIPALSTRRTETEVELRDGQTFAIAGLMNNTVTDSMRKIPGIGDIPILGWLFKSRAMQKNQTELVVMITPYIVRRGQMGVSEGLPTPVEPYLGRPNKSAPNPDAYTGSPRYPSRDNQRPSGTSVPAPQSQAQPNAPAPSTGSGQAPSTASGQQPLDSRPLVDAPVANVPVADTPPPAPNSPVMMTSEQRKALEKAQKAEEKRAREQAKKDEEARKRAEKIAREQAKRQAEIDKKNAEIARKKAEEDAKREKALAEAAARLKQAQAAYQAEVEKGKEGSNDKPKKPGTPPGR
jgi:pilus assembly protein CpaC